MTYKQRLFVEAFLGEAKGNGSEAARIAGYAHPGRAAAKLVVKSCIRAAVETRVAAAAMSANEVLARISEIASSDIGDFLKDDGQGGVMIDLTRARKARRTRVIKKVKTSSKTTVGDLGETTEVKSELELYDVLDALNKLAQYHNLYKQPVNAGQDVNFVITYADLDPTRPRYGAYDGKPAPPDSPDE